MSTRSKINARAAAVCQDNDVTTLDFFAICQELHGRVHIFLFWLQISALGFLHRILSLFDMRTVSMSGEISLVSFYIISRCIRCIATSIYLER